MTFIFSKLLAFILNPLIWIFVLILWCICSKNKKRKQQILIFLSVTIFIFGNTFIFNQVVQVYESKYPKLQKYDYGLLLGGFSNYDRNEKIVFSTSSDRLAQCILLYKKGIIKKIIVSSGNANVFNKRIKEADLAVAYLLDIGIPAEDVIIENQSRNTKENLINSGKFFHQNSKVLVITSAWHIPRVKLIAQKMKLDYYPTNSLYSVNLGFGDYFIPNLHTLNNWSIIAKEWVGCLTLYIGLT